MARSQEVVIDRPRHGFSFVRTLAVADDDDKSTMNSLIFFLGSAWVVVQPRGLCCTKPKASNKYNQPGFTNSRLVVIVE